MLGDGGSYGMFMKKWSDAYQSEVERNPPRYACLDHQPERSRGATSPASALIYEEWGGRERERGIEETVCMCACVCVFWGGGFEERACVYVCFCV